jgi:hypothetical protein
MTDYATILGRKYPGKLWTLAGDTYEGLTWNSETTKPTKNELDALWPEVQQEIIDAKAENDAKVLSAKNKLKALGLTDTEVTALVG